MGPVSSGALPPSVTPGSAQVSSGPGIPIPSKPVVISNSTRVQSPQVRRFCCVIKVRIACKTLLNTLVV